MPPAGAVASVSAGAHLRQVHLIGAELLVELGDRGFDVAPGLLGENVLTEGVDLLALSAGTVLRLGADAEVVLTGLRNPCSQLDALRPGLMAAVLDRTPGGALVRRCGVMATVRTGGVVRAGDPVSAAAPAGPAATLAPV